MTEEDAGRELETRRFAFVSAAVAREPAESRVTSTFHGSGSAQEGQTSKEASASDPHAGQRGTTRF